jgi:hypothetical protein
MMRMQSAELDLIEELKLRRWARENYSPPKQRHPDWHPIVHEEMQKKDNEMEEELEVMYA